MRIVALPLLLLGALLFVLPPRVAHAATTVLAAAQTRSVSQYDGTVVISGTEPLTYPVFVTANQQFRISGPLTDLLVARYQQRRIRLRGYIDRRRDTTHEAHLPTLMVVEIVMPLI